MGLTKESKVRIVGIPCLVHVHNAILIFMDRFSKVG